MFIPENRPIDPVDMDQVALSRCTRLYFGALYDTEVSSRG